ncbi:MAG: response regulator [Armatimonadetes bacterium]|nr:response regulator [Armatimonadota bacterium]MDW8027048.1 response regulator [Armatimonadota bacterium]
MSLPVLVILLVKDKSDDTSLIERQLQRAGVEFELHVVNDGDEAICYLAGDGEYSDRNKFPLPSLILLDLHMLGKSGFDVLSWIRDQPSLQSIPVVVLAASDDYESVQRALSLGANHYLLKPPSAESLRSVIEELVWASSQPLRILLVDDDPETLPLIKRVLEREFCQVEIKQAKDEIQWRQLFGGCNFDVVITDFTLHWSNGIQIAKQVKGQLPECPVLMLTASGDEELAVAALKAGVDDYIVKKPKQIFRLPLAIRLAMGKVRRQKGLCDIERQFHHFFNNLPVGLTVVDVKGCIIYSNPTLAKMLGYSDPQSMVGLPVFKHLVNLKDRTKIATQLRDEGKLFYETQWKRTDGSTFWGQVFVSANYDEQGKIVSYQASIVDTTDRKNAEEALRQNEAKLKERQQILEKVLNWGQKVIQTIDMNECLYRIYEFVRNDLRLDRVGIFLYDHTTGKVRELLGTDREGKMFIEPQKEFGLSGGAFKEAMESPKGFVHTNDFTAKYNLPPDHSMFGVKEHIVVAMKTGEKLVGFLCADNMLSQKPISELQIEALRLLAGYTAIAVENTKLLEERKNRANLMEKVLKVSREISRLTGLHSCILQIRNVVINEFDFDRAAVWLYDPETDMFCGTYGTGRNGELTDEWNQRIRGDRSVRRALAQPSGFFHIEDYETTFAPVPPIMEGVKEHISVSLWAGDKPVGVITADMLLTQRKITPEQIEALRLFASYAGVAIENARLIEALQKRTFELELLTRLIHLATQRLDPESVARAAVKELEGVFNETALLIMLSEGDKMVVTAANSLGLKYLGKVGIPLGASFQCSQVLLPKEFSRSKDFFMASDLGEVNLPFFRNLAAAGLKSCAIGLMKQQEEVVGAILALKESLMSLSDNEISLTKTITEHLSVAFHNARLFEKLQRTIDELKQTKEALIRQERLKALGQMASGVAHDINNALVPILTFAELLENFEDKTIQEVTKHVKRAIEDIVATVQRLRTFYRPRGPAEEFEPVNLNQVVRQAISMTRPRWYDMAQREGVTIDVVDDFDETLSPIMGNESELRQVFINLLFNSVDAIISKGEKIGKITVRTRRHEGWTIFEVADNGVGMDEETKQRCFEPFFTTKGEAGSGLGLSMVYGIVQRHEGRIEVESELGKGTLFRIWFPVKKEPVALETKPKAEETKVPSLRVLVIDDDQRVLEALKAMLEHMGHQPIVVNDGEEGINAFKKAFESNSPFDLVITDLGMPKMSGSEVTQQIKKLSPNTPVLVITGWGAEQRPTQANYGLGKPIRLSALREAITKIWMQTHKSS